MAKSGSAVVAALVFGMVSVVSARADWSGDYRKVFKDTGRVNLNADWCGGDAEVRCQNKTSCELIVNSPNCSVVELYLEDSSFNKIKDQSYAVGLYDIGLWDSLYNSKIYIDQSKVKKYWDGGLEQRYVNVLLRSSNGKIYEKISVNFKN